jgi:hypothetical protein
VLVCALWKKHLLAELLWVHASRDLDDVLLTPRAWRAPSWSWGRTDDLFSHTTHISCDDCREKASIERLDVDASPSGQLKFASLTSHGRIAHATLAMYASQRDFRILTFGAITHPLMESVWIDEADREPRTKTEVVCFAVYEDACPEGLRH